MFTVGSVEGEDVDGGCVGIGASDENFIAPDDGGRMTDAGELDFPVKVGFGEGGGNGRRVGLALAIGAAEAGPVLWRGRLPAPSKGTPAASVRDDKKS